MNDFEKGWMDTYNKLINTENVHYQIWMQLFYSKEISEYIFDYQEDRSEGFVKEFCELKMKSHRKGLFLEESPQSFADLYPLFVELGYEVDSWSRECYYENGEHLLETNSVTKIRRMQYYIYNPKTLGSLEVEFDVSGEFKIKGAGTSKRFTGFDDMLDKFCCMFNILMDTDHNFKKLYSELDENEKLYEAEKEGTEAHNAYMDHLEEMERQERFTKALANAEAFLKGEKELPFPEVK